MKILKRSILVSVVALCVTAVWVQEADAARRDSLMENRLIEDKDDVFLYPQRVIDYTNLVSFEYGGGEQQGNGMLLLGNENFGFGVAAHRGDLLANDDIFPYAVDNRELNSNAPFAGIQPPGTIIDLFGGFDLGGGAAGARLAFGNGASFVQGATDDGATGTSETFFMLQGGYSLMGDFSLDTSLQILFGTGVNKADGDTQADATALQFGLYGRGYSQMAETLRLGFIGNIQYRTSSGTQYNDIDNDDDDVTNRSGTFAIQAGAGPAYTIGDDNTQLAGYAVLGYATSSTDPNTSDDSEDDRTRQSEILLPGLHLAADIQVLDWLYFRSGLQYSWAIRRQAEEVADEDNDNITGNQGSLGDNQPPISALNSPGGFGWSAGLGVEYNNFYFDGALQNGFILNGPNFIGGGSGFLAKASAGYNF